LFKIALAELLGSSGAEVESVAFKGKTCLKDGMVEKRLIHGLP